MIRVLFTSVFVIGCLSAVAPFSTQAATIAKPANNLSLVGHWSFDEGATTVFGDSSGYGNTGGIKNGAVWSSGKRGRAVDFDGSNDYAEISSVTNLKYTGADMTMSAWIYPDATETEGAYIISKPWNGSGQYNYRLTYDSGRTISLCLYGNANSCVSTTATAARGEWSHIAATISSGGTVTIYINGGLAISAAHGLVSWTPSSGDANLPLSIATLYPYGEGWGGNTAFSFDGKIDDVRIYTRVFSPAEITGLFRSGETVRKTASKTGLLGYWNFDEGTSTIAGDFSGNGYTGTLGSGQTWTTGKRGGAINFDAVDDVVTTTYAAGDQANWTMMAWVYDTKNNGAYRAIIQTNLASDDALYIYPAGTLGYWPCGTAGAVPPNQWVFVTATYEAGVGFKYYINGILAGTGGTCADATDWDFLKFGGHSAGDGERWGGKMDDIRIYTRVLGASEIESIYRSGQTKINAPHDTKLTEGLVGYWTFNGKDLTGTTAADISGQNNNGTLSNAIPVIGKVGQALQFDGTDDKVDLPTSISTGGTANWTGSVWIKTTSSAGQYIMTNQSGGPVTNALRVVSGVINYFHYDGTWQTESGTTAVNDGNWHHLAWVNSSNQTMDMYVDGVLDANDVTSDTTNNGPLNRIGEFWGSGQGVIGSLDELRIYSRTLTAAEVRQLYLMGR